MKTVQLNFNSSADQDDAIALLQSKYDVTAIGNPVVAVTPKAVVTVVPAAPVVIFQDNYDGADGIITNEYAFFNPSLKDAVQSPNWEMTSGSLFRKGNQGWTGRPDSGGVMNAQSSIATNSCVFRCVTKRKDFQDFKVAFDFNPSEMVTGATNPAVAWDGCHVFLRYQSETSLYYASFMRRDGKVVIKKKVTGGSSNGGTYFELTPELPAALPLNTLAKIEATIKNVPTGVQITLTQNGKKVLDVIDNGSVGGAPILTAGGTGLRGDNLNFTFDNFTVTAI